MNTQQDKVSYIIGRQVGGDFIRQGIEINTEIFAKGLIEAYNDQESQISDADTQVVMQAFQQEMQEKAQSRADELGSENRKIGETYLTKNKDAEGVTTTASGLQYKVLESGSGKTPSASSTVETHYEGRLIDGKIFDSSYQRGQTATFPVNGVIAGWTEALQMMKEGDIWEITVPSELAYGAQGAGADIGPHSTLIFKVELKTVH